MYGMCAKRVKSKKPGPSIHLRSAADEESVTYDNIRYQVIDKHPFTLNFIGYSFLFVFIKIRSRLLL